MTELTISEMNTVNYIASAIIGNMTDEMKREFLECDESLQLDYATAFGVDMLNKFIAMGTELQLDSDKMEKFSACLVPMLNGLRR